MGTSGYKPQGKLCAHSLTLPTLSCQTRLMFPILLRDAVSASKTHQPSIPSARGFGLLHPSPAAPLSLCTAGWLTPERGLLPFLQVLLLPESLYASLITTGEL